MHLYDYERLDDLQIKGLMLIQDTRGFCFGVDAVILSHFASECTKKGDKVMDLCTGSGIVPLLLHAKTQASEIYGLEIMEDTAQRAKRSVSYNNLLNVFIKCGDLKNVSSLYQSGSFDVVTCNPPYIKKQSGLINPDDGKAAARHEILCNLDDVVKAAAYLLRFGGKFCMVHRPDRLADVICTLRKYKIEPKRLKTVHSHKGDDATLFLIEGMLGGGGFMKVTAPLYIYDEKGNYSADIKFIYGKDEK